MSTSCSRCGWNRREVLRSNVAGGEVCLPCHLDAERRTRDPQENQRLGRQYEIARGVRSAIEPLRGTRRWQVLRDRALLLETATSAVEARTLVGEMRTLGIEIKGRRAG
jgi:hypothetical protein